MDLDNGGVPDCTSCKWIGAGGCFAGAAYAVFQRSKMPATNSNRQWLALIGVGKSVLGLKPGTESIVGLSLHLLAYTSSP